MAQNNDLNKSFAQMAGIVLFSGLIASFSGGYGAMFIACVAVYFMLVSTNAIQRGEMSKRGKR